MAIISACFVGQQTLNETWQRIAQWLAEPEAARDIREPALRLQDLLAPHLRRIIQRDGEIEAESPAKSEHTRLGLGNTSTARRTPFAAIARSSALETLRAKPFSRRSARMICAFAGLRSPDRRSSA